MVDEGTVYLPLTKRQQGLLAGVLSQEEIAAGIRERTLSKEEVRAAALWREIPVGESERWLRSGEQLLGCQQG